MFKNIIVFLLFFYATHVFAVQIGAGQAQIRNNTQVQKENQRRMDQMRKNQQLRNDKVIQGQPTTPREYYRNN